MKRYSRILLLCLLSAVLLSIPFLVPGSGFLALVGFVPLLYAEEIFSASGGKRFFLWHYGTFVLWNAATTFWVCNATVGGGVFAVLANAIQMSVIFGLFRWSKKRLRGAAPYVFMAFLWIAWEFWYLHYAQISWPWLVLGNAFARTTGLIQWYEFTGTLGGSLWVWTVNLSLYGLLHLGLSGRWKSLNIKGKYASLIGTVLLIALPVACSLLIRPSAEEGNVDVVIVQPNIDPYNKFGGMTQQQQTDLLLSMIPELPAGQTLVLAPETFTNDIVTNDISLSPTVRTFNEFISAHPGVSIMFGASTRDYIHGPSRPSHTARRVGQGWVETHNSALLLDGMSDPQIYHKMKLVVGVEMTPYPAFFCPIDDKLGGLMGRNVGQDKVTDLQLGIRDSLTGETSRIPVGCAICYESVYGEHCTEYVRAGARLLTVITNDAWWKDTPGYRQHLSYASLRAIETRRWIARCANTGTSAIIDPAGRILSSTDWWQPEVLSGKVGLADGETFYVRTGDYIGRICAMMAVLMLLGTLVPDIPENHKKKAKLS